MASDVPEAPEALCLCIGQGSIQAKIRPGIWLPVIRSLHFYEETWKVPANPVVCAKDVIQAVSQLRKRSLRGTVFTVGFVEEKAEESKIEILVFSKLRYVYVIKLHFKAEEATGCLASVKAFASGAFPAWFPLGFLFSALFCFVPFYDCGRNALWVDILRKRMTIPIEIVKKGRKC